MYILWGPPPSGGPPCVQLQWPCMGCYHPYMDPLDSAHCMGASCFCGWPYCGPGRILRCLIASWAVRVCFRQMVLPLRRWATSAGHSSHVHNEGAVQLRPEVSLCTVVGLCCRQVLVCVLYDVDSLEDCPVSLTHARWILYGPYALTRAPRVS